MNTLAIDQGTTSTRALIVAESGGVTPLISLPHRQHYPQTGWVEHDPEELIGNLLACLDAAQAVPDLCAVGIDNQGESCLAWDGDTGRAVSPVIVWQDDRTAADIDRLRTDRIEAMVLERAGLPLDPYFSASKLGWIMREIPEARELAAKGRLRLGTTDAFFLDRLTDRFVTDVTTASRTSLMDLSTCQWDADLCTLFGVPMDALPEIMPSTGDFGGVQVGEHFVPLAASLVDQQASLYGHGCRSPGDAKITFGTGAFALAVTGDMMRTAAGGPLPTIAWQKSGAKPTYALDGGVYSASSAVNWARGLGLFKEFSEIDFFDARPAIDRGIAFVPALAGLACPHWDRSARGAWLGLSLDSSPADMMQALLEGVALRMAEVIDAMQTSQRVASPVSIDGGMAGNRYFGQFLADTLEREIIVSDQPELTAIGTAALAAEAVGRPIHFERNGRHVIPHEVPSGRRERFAAARQAIQSYAAIR